MKACQSISQQVSSTIPSAASDLSASLAEARKNVAFTELICDYAKVKEVHDLYGVSLFLVTDIEKMSAAVRVSGYRSFGNSSQTAQTYIASLA